MGTSPESRSKSTAGLIPTQLKWLFIIDNDESSVKGLVALRQSFATRPIHPTAGMVIVEEKNQPLMQPLHNVSYCGTPHSVIGTTYIVRISAIQGAEHHLRLKP